jgi:hypothetical protein
MRKKLFATRKTFIEWLIPKTFVPGIIEVTPIKVITNPIPKEIHATQFNAFIRLKLNYKL